MTPYTLYIGWTEYYLDAGEDECFHFHYQLGLAATEKQFISFNKALWNHFRKNKGSVLNDLLYYIKESDITRVYGHLDELLRLGKKHHIQIFSVPNHRAIFEDKYDELTQEEHFGFMTSPLIFQALQAIEKQGDTLKTIIVSPAYNEALKKYEFTDYHIIDNDKEGKFLAIGAFFDIVHFVKQCSLDATDGLFSLKYGISDQLVSSLWKDYIYPMVYDKYRRVRKAANEIVHALQSDNDTYHFYGNETLYLKPVLPSLSRIHGPRDMYDILSNLWSAKSCAPRMRSQWCPENKTLGQCSITAFLAQDVFGGEVYGVPLGDGNYHCFNVVEDCVFDLTSEQFSHPLDYNNAELQSREKHFAKKEKRLRYENLKKQFFDCVIPK